MKAAAPFVLPWPVRLQSSRRRRDGSQAPTYSRALHIPGARTSRLALSTGGKSHKPEQSEKTLFVLNGNYVYFAECHKVSGHPRELKIVHILSRSGWIRSLRKHILGKVKRASLLLALLALILLEDLVVHHAHNLVEPENADGLDPYRANLDGAGTASLQREQAHVGADHHPGKREEQDEEQVVGEVERGLPHPELLQHLPQVHAGVGELHEPEAGQELGPARPLLEAVGQAQDGEQVVRRGHQVHWRLHEAAAQVVDEVGQADGDGVHLRRRGLPRYPLQRIPPVRHRQHRQRQRHQRVHEGDASVAEVMAALRLRHPHRRKQGRPRPDSRAQQDHAARHRHTPRRAASQPQASQLLSL